MEYLHSQTGIFAQMAPVLRTVGINILFLEILVFSCFLCSLLEQQELNSHSSYIPRNIPFPYTHKNNEWAF